MVDRIEAFTKGAAPSVRLVLQPEHLGEVQVKLTLEGGAISAVVKVDNPQVRDAVAQQLEAMRVSLADQGIKIDKLEVSVSGGFDQNRPDAQDWLANGQSRGQGDARARHEAAAWALPEVYGSLLQGGGDRAEADRVVELREEGAVDRVAALDVVA
jgi:flagellar hook-length control protein FliK